MSSYMVYQRYSSECTQLSPNKSSNAEFIPLYRSKKSKQNRFVQGCKSDQKVNYFCHDRKKKQIPQARKMSGVGINNDWDDTLLVKAYDRSIKLAQEELARRIARATNTKKSNAKLRDDAAPSSTTAIAEPIACPSNSKQSEEENPSFVLGDYARATYDDGVDYEGKIVAMDEERGTCRIRYIGYENEQEVRISDLVPSWGKKARRMQYNRVQQELDPDEAAPKPGYDSKKTKSHYPTSSNGLPFGAIPPPPPMPPMLVANGENSEHLSAMLMSWYMSGYYTGIYQGMQMAKANAKQKK